MVRVRRGMMIVLGLIAVGVVWAWIGRTGWASTIEMSSAGEQKVERDLVGYARFPEEETLIDGWAIGAEKYLAGKPAAIRAPLGQGQVVLLGFRPDTR